MNDTTKAMKDYFYGLLMSRSPEERLIMGCSMFDSAKKIVGSSLREKSETISPIQMRQGFFLRFYGQEFNKRQTEKILEWLG